jgi:molybdopterin molybdotransferase
MTALAPSLPLVPVAEAQQRLLALLHMTEVERIQLDAAWGRVLAEDVVSRRRIPGCDNSAMDGFAIAAADAAGATAEAPVRLPVLAEARAGSPLVTHRRRTATSVTTGAPLPDGADAVVRVEDVEVDGETIVLFSAVRPGADVRRAGEDVESGTVVVRAGRRLRAADLAACAAAGASRPAVRRRPSVGILSGGDELVPPDVTPLAHQVVDSNAPMLAAAVREAGGDPRSLGVMRDDRDAVVRALDGAARACDLLITSAGVSVGAHDYVRDAVAALGSIDVWRIAVRPGKPLLIGTVGGKPLLGLPGNPVSSAVTFELFGRPAILAMQGAARLHRRRVAVRLADDVTSPRDLETYLRVRLEDGDGALPLARLSGAQGSSMLRSLSNADALAIIPAGVSRCDAGTVVDALELA